MKRLARTWPLAGSRPMRKVQGWGRRLWREWRMVVFFIVFVVVPVKSSLADWNWVPTGSMNPVILEGDLIYVNKVAYDLRLPLTMHRLATWSEPHRGDIVVCLSPDDGTRLVKRVVGEPGDTVQMCNNVLFLNGQRLAYRGVDGECVVQLPGASTARGTLAMEDLGQGVHPVVRIPGIAAMRNFGPLKVPQASYFVLGDNRDVSRDSRYFGVVSRDSILGKARAVILSFDINDKYQPRLGRFLTRLR